MANCRVVKLQMLYFFFLLNQLETAEVSFRPTVPAKVITRNAEFFCMSFKWLVAF